MENTDNVTMITFLCIFCLVSISNSVLTEQCSSVTPAESVKEVLLPVPAPKSLMHCSCHDFDGLVSSSIENSRRCVTFILHSTKEKCCQKKSCKLQGFREQTVLSHPPLILLLPGFRWLGSWMHTDAPQWELLAFLEALSAETFEIESPSSCRPRSPRISARLNVSQEAE